MLDNGGGCALGVRGVTPRGVRVPLHIKLVISYLLVVALALLPTAIYLRTSLHQEQTARARAQLQEDLQVLCERLTSGPPGELASRAAVFRHAIATRVTVLSPSGEVLVDSERPDVSLPNHGDRPEVRAALASGTGAAERVSATTGRHMLYAARRCDAGGAPLAVARLAERIDGIESGRQSVESVLRNAAAVALTVVVLLGLIAALVAVRPLRAIASAARTIAQGDLGATLSVRTGDEIEEVAHALNAVVAMLRDRLVSSGAEEATMQALLDELPVGVVVFDASRHPVRMNPAARTLCGFESGAEAVRAAEITNLPGQRAAMERAAEEARGEPVALSLPWRSDARLTARWVRVYDEDGGDTAALIVSDASQALTLGECARQLRDAAGALRDAASRSPEAPRADALHRLADRCAHTAARGAPIDEPLRVVALSSLVERAWADLGPLTEGRAEVTAGEVGDPLVAERGTRCLDALRSLVHWAVTAGPEVELKVACEGPSLRVSARGPLGAEHPKTPPVALREIGGDAGVIDGEDHEERWIALPCA